MKKFYAFLAAAMTASAMSAAVVAPFSMQRSVNDRPLYSTDNLEAISDLSLDSFRNPLGSKVNANPASRADLDPTTLEFAKMDVHEYIDYFYNITDEDGTTELDDLRWIMQSCEASIADNGDGTLTVTYLGGIGFEYTLNVSESGVSVPLGQILGYYDYNGLQGDLVLVTIDQNNGSIIMDGELQFDVYSDAIQLYDYLGVILVTGGKYYWYCLEIMPTYVTSNATLQYTVLPWEGEEGESQDISNRVYCQFYEGDDETDPTLSISNVMPWNEGVSIEFTFTQVRGVDVILAANMIAYESEELQVSETEYEASGDWYMSACTADADPAVSEDGVYANTILADQTETGITWPVGCDTFGIVDPVYWFLNSYNGFLLPWRFSAAQLIFGDAQPDGIVDIKSDSDAQPVYYNIQGMQVANPQPGQLYIVKQGNKVTKVIK